jgi:phosphotriesterase-related protein
MHIMTVRGAIAPEALGITLPHEHLIIDTSGRPDLPRPATEAERALSEGDVNITVLGLLRRKAHAVRDNLRLNNVSLMIDEVRDFQQAGGQSLVDLTPIGVGRNPMGLRTIAEETGLNIIAGTAYYTHLMHPPELEAASESAIADRFIRELTVGMDATDIRAGIIGEIGLSSPIAPAEERVLRAAACAQQATGAAINVHLSWGKEGLTALGILQAAGADLEHVALSHLDSWLDFDYHRSLADTGAFVEFDCFGIEWHFDQPGMYAPWDPERVTALSRLVAAGYAKQLLISHDTFTKIQLKRYGGWGYAHILTNLRSHFRWAGISDAQIRTIMVQNPKRLLAQR